MNDLGLVNIGHAHACSVRLNDVPTQTYTIYRVSSHFAQVERAIAQSNPSMQHLDSAQGVGQNVTPVLSVGSAQNATNAGVFGRSSLSTERCSALAAETMVLSDAQLTSESYQAFPIEAIEIEDDQDVESATHLTSTRYLEMLRGRLARRNQIIEVIRRAYYQDVILVKEELRHRSLNHQQPQAAGVHEAAIADDRLAGVPSVDLRDALPLFAPAETVLMVHPCETCGGHLELIHGEVR